MESVFNVTVHVIPAAYIREYPQATANSQDDTLQLHVKQYTPKDNANPQKGDVSVIGSHANGFPKELYEPLWVELYHSLKQQGIRIRSIWAIDAAWQGQSGLLNRDKLGNDPSWLDYTRDIYQLINHVRMPRPIVGIGHSFGGAAITGASLMNPRLFNALILMDPVLQHQPEIPEGENVFINAHSPAGLSTFRRDVWPSRAEAKASFAKSLFYQSWDPRVLDCWVQHGLTDTKDGKVTLTTSKHQEVRTFVRSTAAAFNEDGTELLHPERIPEVDPATATKQGIWPIYRSESDALYRRLGQVRPPLLYIFGEDSYMSGEPLRDAKMAVTGAAPGGSGGAAKGKVKQVVGPNLGHLIPMEAPKLCADSAAGFIAEHLEAWRDEEKHFQEFAKQPIEVKSHMGQDIINLYSKGRENKL